MEREPRLNKEIELRENSFLLTWDVEDLIGQLCTACGWKLPESSIFQKSKSELINALEFCFPNSVFTLSSEEISRRLVHPSQQCSPLDALTANNLSRLCLR